MGRRRRRRDERWVKIGSDALSCSSASVPGRSLDIPNEERMFGREP